jgi:hypothetical protein
MRSAGSSPVAPKVRLKNSTNGRVVDAIPDGLAGGRPLAGLVVPAR